jgi:2-amino-4-hydroxy-6-hydroxymethyldihydropteridine diphosphokinase
MRWMSRLRTMRTNPQSPESMEENAVYIGVGSNIGAFRNCIDALERLESDNRLRAVAVSSLYNTSPVSPVVQDDFLNYVVKAQWTGTASELLAFLNRTEQAMGRSRFIPLGPRTIDLDILLFGNLILDEPNLVIPHPHLHERKFTLVPCSEIDPHLIHPVMKKPLRSFLDDIGDEQKIEIFKGPGWEKAAGR